MIVVQTSTLYGGELGSSSTNFNEIDELSADSFKVFFTGKVDAIRAKTECYIAINNCARSASVESISGSHL